MRVHAGAGQTSSGDRSAENLSSDRLCRANFAKLTGCGKH